MQIGNLFDKVGETLLRAPVREPMIVLTVGMAFRRDGSRVEASLAVGENPEPAAPTWVVPYSTFQAGSGRTLSADLLWQINEWLETSGAVLPAGVVWLRLVRPYGFLGLVPWEAGLSAVLGRPVLRLPTFPARAAERTDVLENVVIVDPPHNRELAGGVQARLDALVGAILAGSSRGDTRVHVFCSSHWLPALNTGGADDRVVFHDPVPNVQRTGSTARTGVTMWTDWILAQMGGRGIDAVHLLGRAALGEAEGCYLMSHSPFEGRGFVPDVEVDLEGLSLLLNRAGAWSVSLGPVSAEYRDGMAYVADGLAHRWPGAVLFHADEEAEPLNVAANLLYSTSATTAPRFGDGFLYCHPTFLDRKQNPIAAALAPLLAEQAALLAARAPATERALSWVTRMLPGVAQVHTSVPPAWLGATQRFLESEIFEGLRRGSGDVMMSGHRSQEDDVKQRVALGSGTEEVLNEMRSVVERYLKKKREESSDDRPTSDSRDSAL
jgi:hypothetical protein